MRTKADYRKQHFGMLKVIDCILDSDGKNKGGIWRCICECGKFINVRGYNLHSRRSCGCLGKKAAIKRGEGNRKPEEEKQLTKAYQQYKRSTISPICKKEWLEITSKNCWYCGEDEKQRQIGIAEGLLISCCTRCRLMKLDMTHEQFIQEIKKIYKRLPKEKVYKKG